MSLHRDERPRSILNLVIEIVLVGVGVFLALLANNWQESRQHRALAESTLRNFAEEIKGNQASVQRTREYHQTLGHELEQFVASKEPPTEDRFERSVHFNGVRTVTFEHTAWDLALATQALSYLKPELAFAISKIYTQQSEFQTLENSFIASIYTPASFAGENVKGLATALQVYMGDVNYQEPAILEGYNKVIPQVQSALSH